MQHPGQVQLQCLRPGLANRCLIYVEHHPNTFQRQEMGGKRKVSNGGGSAPAKAKKVGADDLDRLSAQIMNKNPQVKMIEQWMCL